MAESPRADRRPRNPWPWFAALAALGLAERAALFGLSAPANFGDTPTYWRLAEVLLERGLNAYDATRVPGYPLFVGLLGRQETAVWAAQLTLGLVTSLLLFYLAYRLTRQPALGFALGAIYNLAPATILFESNLLSETLTTSLVAGSLALFSLVEDSSEGWQRHLLALLLGICASLAGLVRTLFFFLPVILLPFVLRVPDRWRERLTLGVLFSVPPILLLGGWIAFVHSHYGMLSPTTMGGYHLVQHTGAFFERLPDSEATIRDTYLVFRDQQIAERGVQTNAIWDAIPALTERTGLSFFALSAKLQELSIQLIRENPRLYLRSVIEGWISFWKAPVYWRPELFPSPVATFLSIWKWVGRGLFILANGAFLAGASLAILLGSFRRRLGPPAVIILGTALVLASSVIQTLVDHGDNPRFLVPLQMVVVLVVVWGLWRLRIPRDSAG